MMRFLLILILTLAALHTAQAQPAVTAITVQPTADGGQTYSLTLQLLALMTALTLLPAAVLTMTSFTRIIVVLAILRQAIGTTQTPSNQILLGLALFLTLFIMTPVMDRIYNDAVVPFLDNQVTEVEALAAASSPIKQFMLAQTREDDVALFARISGQDNLQTPEETPLRLLLPAFLTSELKTAFQIGFLLFIPFIIIDLVVASVLMSMGMMMLSPMIISLPFKIMLFVLVDGWSLISGTLAASFYAVPAGA